MEEQPEVRTEIKFTWERHGQLLVFLLALSAQLVLIAHWTGTVSGTLEAQAYRIAKLETADRDFATKAEVAEAKERIVILRDRLCKDIDEIKIMLRAMSEKHDRHIEKHDKR